jgi:hypothetical protein
MARKHAAHPPYDVMVTEAVVGLKDRSAKGSSLFAMKKYIAAHYEVPPTGFSRHVKVSLTKLTEDGTLLRTGNSFKLTPEGRHKIKKPTSSSKEVPKRAPIKKTKVKDKQVPNKPAPKKALKKAAPKRPRGVVKKSARTPAMKRA